MENPVDASNGTVAAIISGVLAVPFLFSKFRSMWSRDSADSAVSNAVKEMLDNLTQINKELREENEDLHDQVNELRNEITKLQMIIAELTNKMTSLTLNHETNKRLDELAREGKIERRSR